MNQKSSDKVTVENVNTPGKTTRIDAIKYEETKRAMLKVLPKKSPGLSFNEICESVAKQINEDIFPGRKKIGWWCKSVQLDLEAKKVLVREATKPLRWYKK